MTVWVDDARIPARVGRAYGRWSHLTADTVEELHQFADRLGLQRSWFQRCKRVCAKPGVPCPHWHYDLVDARRAAAIALGAVRRGETWSGPAAVAP